MFTSSSCISSAAVTLLHCTAAAERRFLASEFGVKKAHRNAKIMMQDERIFAMLQLFFHSVPPLLSIIIQSLNLMLKMHYSQPSMHNGMSKSNKSLPQSESRLLCVNSRQLHRERDVWMNSYTTLHSEQGNEERWADEALQTVPLWRVYM